MKKDGLTERVYRLMAYEKIHNHLFKYIFLCASSFLIECLLFFVLFRLTGIDSLIANPITITVAL